MNVYTFIHHLMSILIGCFKTLKKGKYSSVFRNTPLVVHGGSACASPRQHLSARAQRSLVINITYTGDSSETSTDACVHLEPIRDRLSPPTTKTFPGITSLVLRFTEQVNTEVMEHTNPKSGRRIPTAAPTCLMSVTRSQSHRNHSDANRSENVYFNCVNML